MDLKRLHSAFHGGGWGLVTYLYFIFRGTIARVQNLPPHFLLPAIISFNGFGLFNEALYLVNMNILGGG